MATLPGLRKRIDALDDRLLAILNQRAGCVGQVYALKLKQARGGQVQAFVPGREAEILRRLSARTTGAFPAYGVAPVFREIISACRSLEELPRISYVGAPGSKAQQAAARCFGSVAEFSAQAKLPGVFEDLTEGRADYGVLPVLNGAGTEPSRSLQLLSRSGFEVCAEVSLADRYFVVGKTKAQPTGRDRTSALVDVPKKASLEALKRPFLPYEAVLSPLEGPASRRQAARRPCLLDFNGHQDEPRFRRLLSNLARKASGLKVLGSYPAV